LVPINQTSVFWWGAEWVSSHIPQGLLRILHRIHRSSHCIVSRINAWE
jgi:hypothetical protein